MSCATAYGGHCFFGLPPGMVSQCQKFVKIVVVDPYQTAPLRDGKNTAVLAKLHGRTPRRRSGEETKNEGVTALEKCAIAVLLLCKSVQNQWVKLRVVASGTSRPPPKLFSSPFQGPSEGLMWLD